MKRITLAMMLVAVGGAVAAQTPPTPPVRPAPATPATPIAPEPMPAPRAARAPIALPALSPIDEDEMRFRLNEFGRLDRLDLDAARETLRARQLEMSEAAREANRFAFEDMRRAQEMTLEHARLSVDAIRDFAPPTPLAPMEPMPAMAPLARMALEAPRMAPMPLAARMSEGFVRPSPQFFQGDPADSAYRFAYDVLTRGDYGRAAQLFRDVAQKYPKSSYQNDLPYWEAYARYKIGTTDELHSAVKLLEPRASKLIGTTSSATGALTIGGTPRPGDGYYGRRGASDNDVVTLYIRVNSTLAQRGDRGAADIVAKAAQSGVNTCDREDMQVRAEALAALSQMDPAAALPRIKSILEKKDECSAELRRRAVFMLGRRGDAEAATLLGTTAKSDPSVSVRSDAISWLPKLQGDAGVAVLEDLLRTEQDESITRSVVHTLVASDNPKARTSMRALIERKDAPLNLRIEAISSFNNDRTTTEDAAYLRGLYARADNDRIKEAIVSALGRIGGPENDAFVLSIAKNQNESSQIRSQAIARLMRGNTSIADLGKLYDASESLNIRQQIVSQLDRRPEAEAADKLVDIAKNSTIQNIRMQALNALIRKKDPRSTQLVSDLVDGKKP